MIWIAFHDLLPTALQYSKNTASVTWSVMGGMFVMAASLVLVAATGSGE